MKAVLLHRINPAQNEKRFYWIQVGASLVDDWAVIRIWGRIGQTQKVLVTPCSDKTAALKLARQLYRKRIKSGYTRIMGEIDDQTVSDNDPRSAQSQS